MLSGFKGELLGKKFKILFDHEAQIVHLLMSDGSPVPDDIVKNITTKLKKIKEFREYELIYLTERKGKIES